MRSSAAEYLTYVASVGDGGESFEIRYEDENIWLTQKMLAGIYGVEVPTINYHIKKVFEDAELQEDSVIRKFLITAPDGKKYNVNHYGLQMAIAVGFKVNSERAVQFRKWVNAIAMEYTIKGWVMDDERLKQGAYLTDKYFEEQLERVREIRASERRFYQKITDAELIVDRADSTKKHMGLTTWKDAPEGKIIKSDVVIAKNYLSAEEMAQLNRLVNAYLDYAETMAQRKIPMTMHDWEQRLNGFIRMFEYGVLTDAGKVTAEIARLHAESEFEKYRVIQDREYLSDYDRYLLELEERCKKKEQS